MIGKRTVTSYVCLAVILVSSLLFTACSSEPDTSKEDIQLVVESYFRDLKSGKLAEDEFVSEYALDAPLQKLDIKADDSEMFMQSGLEACSFVVKEVVSSVAEAKGICVVNLTAIDMDSIRKSFSDEKLTRTAFEAALRDPKVAMKDNMVSLEMSYDVTEKKWSIVDTGRMSDILGEPYVDLVFEADPYEAVNEFMAALISGDKDTIKSSSYSLSYQAFYSKSPQVIKVMEQYYKTTEYELGEIKDESGDTMSIEITFSVINLEKINNTLFNDEVILKDFFKVFLLGLENNLDETEINDQLLEYYSGPVMEAINSPESTIKTYDGVITLVRSENGDRWVVKQVPDVMNGLDLVTPSAPDPATSVKSLIAALDELLAEGSIDQATYDGYMNGKS